MTTPQQRTPRIAAALEISPNSLSTPISTTRAINLQGLGLTSLVGTEATEALQVLNIQRNQLTSFYGLPTMPALKFLHAEDNQITSFLGMSHQPMLEMLSLEGNPISQRPHFRLMALLSCGERLSIINHTVVTSEEREAVIRLGGSAGIAAKCVSYGWLDVTPEPLTRQGYDQLLARLKVTYTNQVLALDQTHSVGAYMSKSSTAPISAPKPEVAAAPVPPPPPRPSFVPPLSEVSAGPRGERWGDPYMSQGSAAPISAPKSEPRPRSVSSLSEVGPGTKLTLDDLRRHQAPLTTSVAFPPPPPSRSMPTVPRATTALKLTQEELDSFTTWVMFAHGPHSLAVSIGSMDHKTPFTLLSPAASCAITREGGSLGVILDLTHLARDRNSSSRGDAACSPFLRVPLTEVQDIILDDVTRPPCVKIQPDSTSRKIIVCSVTGDNGLPRVNAFFKVLMAVKCTPSQLGHLYSE